MPVRICTTRQSAKCVPDVQVAWRWESDERIKDYSGQRKPRVNSLLEVRFGVVGRAHGHPSLPHLLVWTCFIYEEQRGTYGERAVAVDQLRDEAARYQSLCRPMRCVELSCAPVRYRARIEE